MKVFLILRILSLCIIVPGISFAQQYRPSRPGTAVKPVIANHSVLQEMAVPEADCSNNVDDNGNGLTDLEDFHCYFNPDNFYGKCQPSKIVWGSTPFGFYYVNIETRETRVFNSPGSSGFSDLSWTSDGKLYASGDYGPIYLIDPYTFEATPIGEIEGHYYTNGMTGDGIGNLYVASFVSENECNILQFNPVTGKSKIIFPLTANGLTSAGDLCFLNGYLYVSCMGNKIARINLSTLEFKVIKIINPPLRDDIPDVGSYGMVTLGDGYLYLSDNKTRIWKVDPNTGQGVYIMNYDEFDLFTTGLATYPDVCNAPGCRGEVNIEIKSQQPFCSNTGVILQANGKGITDGPLFTWIFPDKSIVTAQTITATISGEYTVKYYSAHDTCSIISTVKLDIIQHPSIFLGNDTLICPNQVYNLEPLITTGIQNYVWHDGSSGRVYPVSDTGRYYVTASNVCGADSDTIQIGYKPTPVVRLRSDTAVCRYDFVELRNLETNPYEVNYEWSTGHTSNVLKAYDPGVYWVDVSSGCTNGIVRDSVTIVRKVDDCECFLYVPNAFTPNGDGKNDKFSMKSECIVKGTLEIYNRWGELLFVTSDVLSGWNGLKGTIPQPTGLYVYNIRFEYEGRPGVYNKKGTVHLLH